MPHEIPIPLGLLPYHRAFRNGRLTAEEFKEIFDNYNKLQNNDEEMTDLFDKMLKDLIREYHCIRCLVDIPKDFPNNVQDWLHRASLALSSHILDTYPRPKCPGFSPLELPKGWPTPEDTVGTYSKENKYLLFRFSLFLLDKYKNMTDEKTKPSMGFQTTASLYEPSIISMEEHERLKADFDKMKTDKTKLIDKTRIYISH